MSSGLIELRWSPAWAFVAGDTPAVTAGPDLCFELGGLDPSALATLEHWSAGHLPAIDTALDPHLSELQTLLLGLGALVPCAPEMMTISILGRLPTLVRDVLAQSFTIAPAPTSGSVELVVRTESEWPTPSAGVHLGVDLAHHHTVVLGPLVVPGISSCLSCLDRLVTRRWGRDVVPSEPAVARWASVTAELLTIQLEGLRQGSASLVNATIAWNLQEGTVEREALLRAPECGGPCRAPSVDRLDLPWAR